MSPESVQPSDSPSPAALSGRKVLLRPLQETDAEALLEAAESSREALRRWVDWASTPLNLQGELDFVRRTGSVPDHVWGLFELRTGRLAGAAALRRLEPEERAQARLTLWVRADRQGRGYATEAARLLVEHALRRMGLHRVGARIDPANRSARKVLKKAGFRYEGCLRDDRRAHGRWVDQECWGFLKSDWKR
ncbi:MAG: GNAT family protein [Elusimicrobiota bacterium]|jgi:RimJ/RimL family protein N-acetyltransferase